MQNQRCRMYFILFLQKGMEESNKTVNEENQVTDEPVSSINTYFSHF